MTRSTSRPPQRRRSITAILAIVAMIATAAHSASALMTTSAGVTHTTTSAACFRQAKVQTGTTTSTGNGVTTVTLATAVTMSSSFLLFSVASNSNRPVGSEVMGRLASTTSVEFERVTDESSTINIRWSVVAYTCGVSVQRGIVNFSAATSNVTISAVPSLAQAFVTWSQTTSSGETDWGANDQPVVELTSTTNLSITLDGAILGGLTHEMWWQVVSFTDPTMINVQRGSTSMANGVTSATATISSVNTARTFVLVDARHPDSGNDIGSGMVRGRLTNATTITIDRAASNYAITETTWQAIELKDGSTVQSGTAALSAGTATVTAAISAVTLARSTVFASTQVGPGQSGGRSSYLDDDVIGAATTTLSFNSTTQISLTRNNTSFATDIAWYVVQWGKP